MSTTVVLLSGYAVGLVAGFVAYMVRKALGS